MAHTKSINPHLVDDGEAVWAVCTKYQALLPPQTELSIPFRNPIGRDFKTLVAYNNPNMFTPPEPFSCTRAPLDTFANDAFKIPYTYITPPLCDLSTVSILSPRQHTSSKKQCLIAFTKTCQNPTSLISLNRSTRSLNII